MANVAPELNKPMAAGDQTPGGVIRSQIKRQLRDTTWSSGGSATVDIPVDDCYKRLMVRLNGSFSVTYGSTSPVIGGLTLEKLIKSIQIKANGQETIKNVTPYFMRMFDVLVSGETPRRAVTKQAGAFSTRIPLTEMEYGGTAFQATTGYMLVESVYVIYFEHPLAYEVGKSLSMFNARGLASATIEMQFGTYADLDELTAGGGSTVVTFAADLPLTISIELESAPSTPREEDFLLFKQSVATYSYSAAQTNAQILLPRGNLISGVHLLVQNGDSYRRLSDAPVSNISIEINGQRTVKKTTFLNAQAEMKVAFGIRSPQGTAAQGVTHILQGYCYLGFMRDGAINSCLDSSLAAGVDSVALKLDINGSAPDAATFTNPVLVSVMTDELAPPMKRFG